jgi:hypothetical protein
MEIYDANNDSLTNKLPYTPLTETQIGVLANTLYVRVASEEPSKYTDMRAVHPAKALL